MLHVRLAWPLRVAALAMLTAGCLPSISDLDNGPLTSDFAVSDFFAPSGYMGDGQFFGSLVGTANEGCRPRVPGARGNCYAFTYYPNTVDADPWAGVFWVFPSNSWGSTSGHAIDIANYKQISFWAAIEGPTPYQVSGSDVPFVGQAGGIDPKGRYVNEGETDFVDGLLTNNAWTVNDPMAGITTEMKQFHIPLTPFQKGANCQDPSGLNPDNTPSHKAVNCKPNAMAQQMGLTPEQAFQAGQMEATFLIGAFAWAVHYPTDVVNCKPDPMVPDCKSGQHSSHFVNPTPVRVFLDDIVWSTQDPPATP